MRSSAQETQVRSVPAPARRSERETAVLVLLCQGWAGCEPRLSLEKLQARLHDGIPYVTVRVHDGLCHDPTAIKGYVNASGATRLVLGLCAGTRAGFEVQRNARRAGIDPLGVQVVSCPAPAAGPLNTELELERRALRLRAAVARASVFSDSTPQSAKAVLASEEEPVSRRALFTLPPITYQPIPDIDGTACQWSEGCDQCVRACPYGALSWSGAGVALDRERCRSCGLCVAGCPHRAICLPGWSAGEIEAELSNLLEPADAAVSRRIAFVCQDAPDPGGGWLPVRVACLGMVPAAAALASLAHGADTIGFLGCGEECRNGACEAAAERVDFCRQVAGIVYGSADRVRLIEEAPAPPEAPLDRWRGTPVLAQGPATSVPESGEARLSPRPPARAELEQGRQQKGAVRVFGVEAAADAVRLVAKMDSVGEGGLRVEHPGAPCGLVKIDPDACTACGTCIVSCPTKALAPSCEPGSGGISFDPALCIACEECRVRCPEREAGAITVVHAIDGERTAESRFVLLDSRAVSCERCGRPFASRALLERIAAMLGEEFSQPAMGRLCPGCRGIGARVD